MLNIPVYRTLVDQVDSYNNECMHLLKVHTMHIKKRYTGLPGLVHEISSLFKAYKYSNQHNVLDVSPLLDNLKGNNRIIETR